MFVDDADGGYTEDAGVYHRIRGAGVFAKLYFHTRHAQRGIFQSGAICNAGHDGHDFRQSFPDPLSGAGAPVIIAVCHGGVETDSRGSTEAAIKFFVLGSAGFGFPAVWHVHDIWLDRLPGYYPCN